MEPFTRLEAVAAPLPRDNVDTDALFPAHFIQRMDVDYATALFANWRFVDGASSENPGFVLNQPAYRGARILVGGENFGCGSSREHAVWALAAYGVRCVVAKSFGDIFHGNCFKNGVLPVTLDDAEVTALFNDLEKANDKTIIVDLNSEEVVSSGRVFRFRTDPGRRRQLLEGLDEIGWTLRHGGEIDRFQGNDRRLRPWVYPDRPTALEEVERA